MLILPAGILVCVLILVGVLLAYSPGKPDPFLDENGSRLTAQVSGPVSVTALGGRGYHSLAIKSDGSVWAWGFNSNGQLGDGTTRNLSVPVQVIGLSKKIFLPHMLRKFFQAVRG